MYSGDEQEEIEEIRTQERTRKNRKIKTKWRENSVRTKTHLLEENQFPVLGKVGKVTVVTRSERRKDESAE